MARTLLSESTPKTGKTKTAEDVEDRQLLSESGPFNLAMWAAGVKPIERSIPLYQRLDLLAERDQVAEALEDAKATGDDSLIADLRAKAEEITEQIQASRISVTIQGIAPSRFQEALTEAKTNKNLKDAADVQLWIVANQIAAPEGFTFDVLKQLNDLMPAQIERLCNAVNQVNSAVPNVKATVPF